jgi:hypothetical protein
MSEQSIFDSGKESIFFQFVLDRFFEVAFFSVLTMAAATVYTPGGWHLASSAGVSDMISVLQRMCWNTNGWERPSGERCEGGDPAKQGYGNEEWNFCIDDALHGYVFGYLFWQPRKNLRHEHFQVLFWTRQPSPTQWLLVGAYRDASLATKDELQELDVFFDRERIYKRRLGEALGKVDRADQRRRRKIREGIPNSARHLRFKCPVEKVEIFQQRPPLPRVFGGRSVGAYFARPTFLKKPVAISSLHAAGSESPLKHSPSRLLEDVYPRATPASLKMIYPRHKELSNQFVDWLRRNGKTTVVGQERKRVDVEFKDGACFCRAELKVCYGVKTTHGIREALGQLLEYNYYGSRTPAGQWYIVLDTAPAKGDIAYLRKLAREKLLPLSLCWKLKDDFRAVSLAGES